jgi:uncharacterized protein (TIGR03382 family)
LKTPNAKLLHSGAVNRMLRSALLLMTVLAADGSLLAGSVPGSSCTYNGTIDPVSMQAPGLTCNLYPSTNTTGGTGTFNGNFVSIPLSSIAGFSGSGEAADGITDGYLVIVKSTAALTFDPNTGQNDDSNQSDWLQVVEFAPATVGQIADGNQFATSLALWTAGCSGTNPADTSCFPSFATITGASAGFNGSYLFVNEGAVQPAWNMNVFDPTPGSTYTPTYTINYVSPAATPEPATFMIGLGGLALVVALRRRN